MQLSWKEHCKFRRSLNGRSAIYGSCLRIIEMRSYVRRAWFRCEFRTPSSESDFHISPELYRGTYLSKTFEERIELCKTAHIRYQTYFLIRSVGEFREVSISTPHLRLLEWILKCSKCRSQYLLHIDRHFCNSLSREALAVSSLSSLLSLDWFVRGWFIKEE